MAKSFNLKPMEITLPEYAPSWASTFYAAVGVISYNISGLAWVQQEMKTQIESMVVTLKVDNTSGSS